MSVHQTYIEDVVLRKALIDIWRAVCVTCHWQGPKRYSRADVEADQCRHAQVRVGPAARPAPMPEGESDA